VGQLASIGGRGSAKRTGVGVHGTSSDQASLNELVRISTKNLAILAVGCSVTVSSLKDAQRAANRLDAKRAAVSRCRDGKDVPSTRLSLIGVDDEVSWSTVGLPVGLVHEGPLETGGESSSSSATETRVLDLLNDPRVALEDDILGAVPVATFL
jgi:hypothetical protein